MEGVQFEDDQYAPLQQQAVTPARRDIIDRVVARGWVANRVLAQRLLFGFVVLAFILSFFLLRSGTDLNEHPEGVPQIAKAGRT